MSDMLKRKIEEQNKLFNRMQEIQRRAEEEGRDWTAEERANWDAANARIDEVSADIERLERTAKLAEVDYRQVVQAQGADEPHEVEDRGAAYERAFGAFLRGGMDPLSAEQRKIMLEHRAVGDGQVTATPNMGGYLVPEGYRRVMTEALKAYGGLINHANVITTTTGNPLAWPSNDDTSNKGALLEEANQVTRQDVTFGTNTLEAFTYTSNLVLVSIQLLQDSAFDLDAWLPRKLGERIGRAVADDLIGGSGSGEPEGIVDAVSAVPGAGDTSGAPISYDDIIDLEHAVDPAYRAGGNCRFLLNDKTLAALRKLKDGDDRPLWQPVPVPGMPATINGLPYTIDQSMPDAEQGERAVLFGDFRAAYIVRQVRDVQMVRLAERYADYLQVGFFGFVRLDGRVDNAAAVKALEVGTGS